MSDPAALRLDALPGRTLPGGLELAEARAPAARLRGLAGLDTLPPGRALHLPQCRSVHTFGMRLALDLVWLGGAGEVVRLDYGVPPGRVRACRRARSVLECAAGAGDAFAAAVNRPLGRPACRPR
jgi:uncharacterized protein